MAKKKSMFGITPPLPKDVQVSRNRQDARGESLFKMGLTKEPYGVRDPGQKIKDTYGSRDKDIQLTAMAPTKEVVNPVESARKKSMFSKKSNARK